MTDAAPSQPHLGQLAEDDPLYGVLAGEALPALGLRVDRPVFDVFALDGRGVAYRYTERQSGADLACKFYGNRRDALGQLPPWRAVELLRREYANLHRARGLGLTAPPHRVVRPLAIAPAVNAALVMEYVAGPDLDRFLRAAVLEGRPEPLAARLGDLARFLAALHGRSRSCVPVDPAAGPAYLARVLGQLTAQGALDGALAQRLATLRDAWAARPRAGAPRRCLIHGDVTPVNIVFGPAPEVVALDLERLREDDPAADLGMVMGELFHAFLRSTGAAAGAEPLAATFLQAYALACALDAAAAAHLAERTRPYVGSTMLRICRNDWLDGAYKRALSEEAERWLATDAHGR
jgi:Ser/Thr protein kinase RdoA (MazF antagonist)